MRLRKLGNAMNLKGKRVLIRIDGNVPIVKGRAIDGPHGRIARSAVDINWLSQRGARVIVMTHVGRPQGKYTPAYSVKPIAKRLSSLLGFRIQTTHWIVGKDVERVVAKMEDGEVLLLENLRFDPREVENATSFAEALARLGDIYVNDAFSVSHRAHTSVDGITSILPSYAGPLFAQEIMVLDRLEKKAKHPFVLALGGLKMTTKLPIIQRFASEFDAILLGGAIANVFFVAQGTNVGVSVFEKEAVAHAKKLLRKFGEKFLLPRDVVCVGALRKDARRRVVGIDHVGLRDRIVDIGPETRRRFQDVLSEAKTIVWNGPFGYCEIAPFCEGTREIARTIAKETGHATTIVGGGDTLPLVESLNLSDKFTLLSTGGAALLQFLAGEPLPGLEALRM